MKKVLFVLVLIAVIAAAFLFRCGSGFGFGSGLGTGSGKDDGDGNDAVVKIEEEAAESNTEEAAKSIDHEEDSKEIIVKVSVAGSDYFYENEKIELDMLLQEIKKIEGSYVVEIKDEQASKKAYEALIRALKEDGIRYIEK
jgi:hypothetical protein